MRLRSAAAVAAATAALVTASAGAALAVQTDQFGLRVGDSDAAALVIPAGSGTVHHEVLVTNRTNRELTIELAAVDVQRSADGTFSYGSPDAGTARALALGQQSVHLAPRGSARVPVRIAAPARLAAPEYAAVVGVADGPRSDQLSVRSRLAVLVELTNARGAAGAAAPAGWMLGLTLLVAGAAGLLLCAGAAWTRRRRAVLASPAAPLLATGLEGWSTVAPTPAAPPAGPDPVMAAPADDLSPAPAPLPTVPPPSSVDRLRSRH